MTEASVVYKNVHRFMALHDGLNTAFGTGEGRWVKRSPTKEDFTRHLLGQGPGIGIAPLRPDNKVMFAAIDLDEPDFDAARLMQTFIPGRSFVERSRSGNAHVLVYFATPIEAWVPMGVLKECIIAAGKKNVEVFPKNHDFERVQFGNYINLSYHGDSRPVLRGTGNWPESDARNDELSLETFLEEAEYTLNDPEDWKKRARWLLISPPEQRETTQEFGTQKNLHICAQHVISGDAGPVTEGHRSVVYFSLAKMLCNWEAVDHDEIVEILQAVNEDAGPDSISDSELLRIIGNAERGRFTSTGCDDPLFLPFAHPDCKIANP